METLRCTALAAFFVAVLGLNLGRVFLLCMSAQEHTFDGKENACNLAYSAVQVPAGYMYSSEPRFRGSS